MAQSWDLIELGLGEFLAGDPDELVIWLDHATAYMAECGAQWERYLGELARYCEGVAGKVDDSVAPPSAG